MIFIHLFLVCSTSNSGPNADTDVEPGMTIRERKKCSKGETFTLRNVNSNFIGILFHTFPGKFDMQIIYKNGKSDTISTRKARDMNYFLFFDGNMKELKFNAIEPVEFYYSLFSSATKCNPNLLFVTSIPNQTVKFILDKNVEAYKDTENIEQTNKNKCVMIDSGGSMGLNISLNVSTQAYLNSNKLSAKHIEIIVEPAFFVFEMNPNEQSTKANHDKTINTNYDKTKNSNYDKTINSNHDKTINSNYDETINSNYDKTKNSNYDETKNSNYDETIKANHYETTNSKKRSFLGLQAWYKSEIISNRAFQKRENSDDSIYQAIITYNSSVKFEHTYQYGDVDSVIKSNPEILITIFAAASTLCFAFLLIIFLGVCYFKKIKNDDNQPNEEGEENQYAEQMPENTGNGEDEEIQKSKEMISNDPEAAPVDVYHLSKNGREPLQKEIENNSLEESEQNDIVTNNENPYYQKEAVCV
ncbi:hypothetical protein TRFO_23012 [Tritrichomonas foetus]|uniref:Uncharacterized protein n=1 Tax=Tritrichomonas foetus TaxID=1144522 RepID=A0A1J4KGP1_9EUKA|nr:hypothetical protein TRFO_23012 [Tritrichomonas foetus]|eukprot:OHT08493.1 hypothetical protein TRFO_23012 [Tritrichomonas foetus]